MIYLSTSQSLICKAPRGAVKILLGEITEKDRKNRVVRPMKKVSADRFADRLFNDGFINDIYYEKFYEEDVLCKIDFTSYFWKKYGTSDTEHIYLAERGERQKDRLTIKIIYKQLVKLGYKCVNLYRTRKNPKRNRL